MKGLTYCDGNILGSLCKKGYWQYLLKAHFMNNNYYYWSKWSRKRDSESEKEIITMV